MIDHDAVRDWAWWSSPEWARYCTEYGSEPGRPVKGDSYVVDLTQPLHLSHGHKQRSVAQHDPVNVHMDISAYHRVHTATAGRETRSQETWDIMQEWIRRGYAVLYQSGPAWALVMRHGPGAYWASGAGRPGHKLQLWIIYLLRRQGLHWYELGDAATPGIATFKAGFGSEIISPTVVNLRDVDLRVPPPRTRSTQGTTDLR